MPLFPSSPSVDKKFISSGKQWQWTGLAWKRIPLDIARFRPITPGVYIMDTQRINNPSFYTPSAPVEFI